MIQTPIQKRNTKLIEEVSQNLRKRYFDVYIAQNGEEAAKIALDLIPNDATVGWGGSVTVDAIGIKDALKERGNPVIDRALAKSPEEGRQMMKACLTCNTFLMSANAVSEDGVLVNIDGNGNISYRGEL